MNIRLCDSEDLQKLIRDKAKAEPARRTQVPKAQLHPELLFGIVECDREHFEIRSEINAGDRKGESDPIDVKHLETFLPEPDMCSASWKVIDVKQGESFQRIPTELIFAFDRGGKIVVRTQAVADVTKLTGALPTDQKGRYQASFAGGCISLKKEGAAKVHPTVELRTQCGINGVKWSAEASRETLLEQLAEAIEKKNAKKRKDEPVTA